MERFFRNKRLFTACIVSFFIIITVGVGVSSFLAYRTNEPLSKETVASTSSLPESSVADPSQDSSSTASSDHSAQQEAPSPSSSEAADGSSSESVPDAPTVQYNKPDEMRAVYLMPGKDYPMSGDGATIKAAVDSAVEAAKGLSMNAVVAVLEDGNGAAIYKTEKVHPAAENLDVLAYIIEKARAEGLYVYALYKAAGIYEGGTLITKETVDLQTIDFAAKNAGEFAGRYSLDGLLIDTYYNPAKSDSYAQYMRSHTGIGYQAYLQSYSEALVRGIVGKVLKAAPGMQIGLVVDGAWENAAAHAKGSNTSAAFTALSGGNADTKKYVAEGFFHFIVMRPGGSTDSAAESFKVESQWWGAEAKEAGIPLYILHPSDKICTDAVGYSSPDEIVQQVILARESSNFEGSMFNDLPRLKENPQTSTDLLIKLYRNEVKVDHIMTELAVTAPDKSEFSTFEPVMVFRGASDPNFEVKCNEQVLETDDNGYFGITQDLQPGLNTFTFEHKGKTRVFRITRNVQIVQEVSPSGSVSLEGGMQLTITASAYSDATVSFTLGSNTVAMERDASIDDTTQGDTSYSRFIGTITVPAGTAQRQSLGAVVVHGSWEGISDSKEGASIAVNAVVAAGDGDLVVVTADSAKTFPTGVLNNESNPDYYPLPKGTLDYTVGEALTFKNDSGTYKYYKLQSGVRVYADDINKTSGTLTTGNVISSMKISSDKHYTYVALDTQQAVPYFVQYSSGGITFQFKYTNSVPQSQSISDNPIIQSANWSDDSLTLQFTKGGSFVGYYAYYKDDTLILRLTNPPTSIKNVRVAIDPGHGGKDRGASGYYPEQAEADINLSIAQKTAQALKDKGAVVKLLQTDPYLTLNQRIDEARAFDADIFISIHSNTSINASATGTEVYYFYPNGAPLASAASKAVSGGLDTINRGAKQARYWVTTDSRFASILIECGFISNKEEYRKLLKSSYQANIAEGIANAVVTYVKTVSTGIAGGNDSTNSNDKDEEEDDVSGGAKVTGVKLNKSSLQLAVGESEVLEATVKPSSAKNSDVSWSSDDEEVVTVSASGKVRAVGVGTALVTVAAKEGDYTAECEVEVTRDSSGETVELGSSESDPHLASLKVSETRIALTTQQDYQIAVTVEPTELQDKVSLTYTTDDEDVATVDETGLIRATGEGAANIRIQSSDGSGVSARIKVTVSAE